LVTAHSQETSSRSRDSRWFSCLSSRAAAASRRLASDECSSLLHDEF